MKKMHAGRIAVSVFGLGALVLSLGVTACGKEDAAAAQPKPLEKTAEAICKRNRELHEQAVGKGDGVQQTANTAAEVGCVQNLGKMKTSDPRMFECMWGCMNTFRGSRANPGSKCQYECEDKIHPRR